MFNDLFLSWSFSGSCKQVLNLQTSRQYKGINTRCRQRNIPLRTLNHHSLRAMKSCNTTRHMPQSFTCYFFNKASLTFRTQCMELTADGYLFWCAPFTLYYWCICKSDPPDLPSVGHAMQEAFTTEQMDLFTLERQPAQVMVKYLSPRWMLVQCEENNYLHPHPQPTDGCVLGWP